MSKLVQTTVFFSLSTNGNIWCSFPVEDKIRRQIISMIIFSSSIIFLVLALVETESTILSRNDRTHSNTRRSPSENGRRLAHKLGRQGPRIAAGLNTGNNWRDEIPSISKFARSFPFPTYAVPPQTSFSCSNVNLPGFYADPETQCQVIRRCTLSNFMFSYICPNGTVRLFEFFLLVFLSVANFMQSWFGSCTGIRSNCSGLCLLVQRQLSSVTLSFKNCLCVQVELCCII